MIISLVFYLVDVTLTQFIECMSTLPAITGWSKKSKWPHISFYWLTNNLKKYYATFYETIKGDFDHSAQQISKNERLLSRINSQFTGRPDWPHKTQWTCLLW